MAALPGEIVRRMRARASYSPSPRYNSAHRVDEHGLSTQDPQLTVIFHDSGRACARGRGIRGEGGGGVTFINRPAGGGIPPTTPGSVGASLTTHTARLRHRMDSNGLLAVLPRSRGGVHQRATRCPAASGAHRKTLGDTCCRPLWCAADTNETRPKMPTLAILGHCWTFASRLSAREVAVPALVGATTPNLPNPVTPDRPRPTQPPF